MFILWAVFHRVSVIFQLLAVLWQTVVRLQLLGADDPVLHQFPHPPRFSFRSQFVRFPQTLLHSSESSQMRSLSWDFVFIISVGWSKTDRDGISQRSEINFSMMTHLRKWRHFDTGRPTGSVSNLVFVFEELLQLRHVLPIVERHLVRSGQPIQLVSLLIGGYRAGYRRTDRNKNRSNSVPVIIYAHASRGRN